MVDCLLHKEVSVPLFVVLEKVIDELLVIVQKTLDVYVLQLHAYSHLTCIHSYTSYSSHWYIVETLHKILCLIRLHFLISLTLFYIKIKYQMNYRLSWPKFLGSPRLTLFIPGTQVQSSTITRRNILSNFCRSQMFLKLYVFKRY